MSEPDTPVEVYKAIIDTLVNDTRRYGSSSHVEDRSIYSSASEHSDFNEFINSLSQEQRILLARMLQEERDSSIHDVLALLTRWITVHDVGLTYQGEPMPVELSGMGLHGDFIGRLTDWDWPTDESDPTDEPVNRNE